MREEIIRWIEQAKADLKAARDNLDTGNYYVVALLCQQTVEKGLKALYILRFAKQPTKDAQPHPARCRTQDPRAFSRHDRPPESRIRLHAIS